MSGDDMIRAVTTVEEAAAALDYFNGFHDGTIMRLAMVPRQVFVGPGDEPSWDGLDVELTFAHDNYAQGTRPADQVVTARFERVMELTVDVSGHMHEWAVYELLIEAASRTLTDGSDGPCLRATLKQSRLVKGEWRRHDDVTFTFDRAEFSES